MTRRTNARIAGIAFLFYIVTGIPTMILMNRATNADGVAAQLAAVAAHLSDVRVAALLTLASSFCAVALGVFLYAITRDEDADLALMGLACRVTEGVIGAMAVQGPLRLAWLARASGGQALDPQTARTLGELLLNAPGSIAGSMFFAVGSLLFSWLMLRGRMIPAALAWLGLVASILWVVGLPLQTLGILRGSATYALWLSMAAFEIPFAIWLILKGVAAPLRLRAAGSL